MAKNSRLILSKAILVDRDYKNVMNLTDDEMVATLRSSSHLLAERANYSFIRPYQNVIQSDIPYGLCEQANYIGFQNPDYGGKWFFAWIDQIKYISENCTEIMYTIDYWETWFSWAVPRQCFVLREHTNNDRYGENIQPEPIRVTNYINGQNANFNLGHLAVIMRFNSGVSIVEALSNSVLMIDGLPSMMHTLMVVDKTNNKETFERSIRAVVNNAQFAFANNVKMAYYVYVPDFALEGLTRIPYFDTSTIKPEAYAFYSDSPLTMTGTYPYTVSSIKFGIYGLDEGDKYIQNNKSLTYPFVKLVVGDNTGRNTDYAMEGFGYGELDPMSVKPRFRINYSLNQGQQKIIRPYTYFGADSPMQYAFDATKLPMADVATQPFYEWLRNTLFTTTVKLATGLSGSIDAGATAEAAQEVVESASRPTFAQKDAAQVAANRARQAQTSFRNDLIESGTEVVQNALSNGRQITSGSPDLITAMGLSTFSAWLSVPEIYELLKVDAFFTKYGYATNQIKTPNWNGRDHFNYVQIGANDVVGYSSAPSVAMDVINSAARAGVTVWHGNDYIGDYSVSNNIVSEG